jgi:arylsulfatase A-like enzyme
MNRQPNILWVCTDQQRYDTIGILGNTHLRTPHIDALVQEGVTFTRAYAQSPLCTPSRASFLTGRYPKSTRSSINGNVRFSRDETLVTKMFADAGYTCGLIGKLHLTAAYKRMEERTDDGYSYMEWSHMPIDNWEPGVNRYQSWLKEKGVEWSKEYSSPCPDWPPIKGYPLPERIKGMKEEHHQTTWCIEKTMEFIDQNKDRPWCASVNIYAPHPPFDPPQSYKDRLNIEDMPLPLFKEGELANKPRCHEDCYLNGSQNGMLQATAIMSDRDKQEVTRDYYAHIELIDTQFGRLMKYLDDNGLRENTIVIFMSDHGEMLGDHGIYWKGGYFYEGLIHVPLIISWPGHIKENLRSEALVELVDLAPTLLGLCGQPIPNYMQGKSFAGILTGAQNASHHKDAVYAEYYYSAIMLHKVYATMYFDGRYKMVVHHDQDISELYDLHDDPNEFVNLWENPEHKDVQHRLVKACFDHAILSNVDCVMGRRSNY